MPTVSVKANGQRDVSGATLALAELGTPSTQANRGPQPASVTLSVAFLEASRTLDVSELTPFATLDGQIELRGSPPQPLFTVPDDADFSYTEPEPENGEPFRELRLAFDNRFFEPEIEDGLPLTRLRLPPAPEHARFFELGVELVIAGATESTTDENDRLAGPLGPLPGPIFEWADELTAELPVGLTLVLEEGGRRMALDWAQGEVLGTVRRFAFDRLRGTGPCTLKALANGQELLLLRDQVINDPTSAIRWDHLLEELLPTLPADDDAEFIFETAAPEIVGTV
jgi:hypothetical protein